MLLQKQNPHLIASLLQKTRFFAPFFYMEKGNFLIFFFSLRFFFSFSEQQKLDEEFFHGGFGGAAAKNMSLDGVAAIHKNGMLQLTIYERRVMGHAFHSSPLRFKSTPNGPAFSFSTSFVFSVVPEFRKLGGHGLAFTISPTKDFRSALPSQFLGILSDADNGNFTNHLFAVEFDTALDLEFQDINDNHIGVDINSLKSNQSVPVAYYDESLIKRNLSLVDGGRIQAWIDYDSTHNLLNVTVSPSSVKPRLPILSYRVDLSPILNETMYVGFSASTGVLASSHYIFGWSFKMNGGEARNLDLSSLPSVPGPKKKHTALILGISLSASLLTISAIGFAVFLIIKIKNADVIEDWELDTGPHRFSYDELKRATKGFRDKELLGCGGFGRVYKGVLPNSGTQVAVKRISHESKQGIREFVSEIETIGRLRHRNLAHLQGWCRRRSDLMLVYDFMENGSLDKYLFEDSLRILSWEERFKVINGVASALLYLHEGYEKVVIHRDVKASNVLLDSEWNGKLGDFGLARLSERGQVPSTTRVVGTLGYLAPELPRTGKATAGSDVYAFGAVMLEVACGRRPVDPRARPEEVILVDWVWDRLQGGSVVEAVDPRLNGCYDKVEAEVVLKLGLMCSHDAPVARPTMRQVVSFLEREAELPEALSMWPAARGGVKADDDRTLDVFAHRLYLTSSPSREAEVDTFAFPGNREVGGSFTSLSTSPMPLLHCRGESR